MAELTLPDAAGRQAAGAFLARLVRMDRAAPVRLRPEAAPDRGVDPGLDVDPDPGAGTDPDPGVGTDPDPARAGLVRLWGRLPFGVLVTRTVLAAVGADTTVRAADLLSALGAAASDPAGGGRWLVTMPPTRDLDWRWSLPPGGAVEVERLPAADVRRVSEAAAATVAAAGAGGLGGRPVGDRVLRDALLDHVPFVVTPDPPVAQRLGTDRVEVPQRLVQGLMRMGFVPPEADAGVAVLSAPRWIGLAARYGACWYQRGRL